MREGKVKLRLHERNVVAKNASDSYTNYDSFSWTFLVSLCRMAPNRRGYNPTPGRIASGVVLTAA
jgi:hypothetical protein